MYCGCVPVPLRVKVKDVAVGKEHSMALTVTGNVITWGRKFQEKKRKKGKL